MCGITILVLLLFTPVPPVNAAPIVTITLLNPPSAGVLELAVGESYTFEILITSDEPFLTAMAMTNAYYPGRGVFWHGGDRAARSTSAILELTVTGKASTADCWLFATGLKPVPAGLPGRLPWRS